MGRENEARLSSVSLPSFSWLLQLTALSLCSSESGCVCEKDAIISLDQTVYTKFNIVDREYFVLKIFSFGKFQFSWLTIFAVYVCIDK